MKHGCCENLTLILKYVAQLLCNCLLGDGQGLGLAVDVVRESVSVVFTLTPGRGCDIISDKH